MFVIWLFPAMKSYHVSMEKLLHSNHSDQKRASTSQSNFVTLFNWCFISFYSELISSLFMV